MPKEEWGVKRLCPTTGKRFYDLGKNPIISPYTGEVVIIDTGSKSRMAPKPVKAKPAPANDTSLLDDDTEVVDDADDADVDLDDDMLDDDDDDTVSLDEIADVATNDDDS
jgi:uncharacterized protein (TIGR02300 family)